MHRDAMLQGQSLHRWCLELHATSGGTVWLGEHREHGGYLRCIEEGLQARHREVRVPMKTMRNGVCWS